MVNTMNLVPLVIIMYNYHNNSALITYSALLSLTCYVFPIYAGCLLDDDREGEDILNGVL